MMNRAEMNEKMLEQVNGGSKVSDLVYRSTRKDTIRNAFRDSRVEAHILPLRSRERTTDTDVCMC